MQNLSELDFLKDGTTILSENYSFYSKDTGGNEDKASSPMYFAISRSEKSIILTEKVNGCKPQEIVIQEGNFVFDEVNKDLLVVRLCLEKKPKVYIYILKNLIRKYSLKCNS
ncbi:MAG: hypothetical protein ACTTH7_09835 [Treponema sp.]